MAEPVFYPKARLPQQDDVSRKARIIDAPTPHDTIKNAQHLMPSPPMNVQPTIKRRGLTILSLPIELVTQIVDELERHVVWKDSSPVHSKPCIEGVCSVRSVHSQLRDSAWPLFARVLSTTDFSLTLGHLSCLVAIVAHPEIPKHMRTLRLSKTSMECREVPRVVHGPGTDAGSCHTIKRQANPPLLNQHPEPQMVLETKEKVISDSRTAHEAVEKRMHEMYNFCQKNKHIEMLKIVFKSLKLLGTLVISDGLCDSPGGHQKEQRPWLVREFQGEPATDEVRDLVTLYCGCGSFSFVANPHFYTCLTGALVKSGIKFRRILTSARPSSPNHGTSRYAVNWAMTCGFATLSATTALGNLHTLKLIPTAGSWNSTSTLNALLSAAPSLKHLHMQGRQWRFEESVANSSSVPALELLDLSSMDIEPAALLVLVKPSLKMLRVHSIDVRDRSGIYSNSEIETMLLDTLQNITDTARLSHLHMVDLAIWPSISELGSLAKRVDVLAFMHTGYTPDVWMDGVYLEVSRKKKQECINPGLGAWTTGRFNMPFSMEEGEETEQLRGLV